MGIRFKKIVFTTPEISVYDVENIETILKIREVDYLHLRKPSATMSQMKAILDTIPARERGRIVIHDHFNLAKEYGLGGVHLNNRCPAYQGNEHISRSCHSIEEIQFLPSGLYSYVTLSPIFPSISKPGYSSRFTLGEWKEQLKTLSYTSAPVIALGGINPHHFEVLREAGFQGAALLGYLYDQNGQIIEYKLNELIN